MSKIDSTDRGLDLSFATSVFATAAVAVAPSFVAFGFLVWSRADGHPFLATITSVLLTFSAFVLGVKVWERQPESSGYSFADLMLWHWMRREWAEEKLVRNARLLGYDRSGRFVGKSKISPERQLQAAREIGSALDSKSSYTINHAKRVEKHARDVAAVLGLSETETEELATAAALHDIGNLRVPEHVARKTSELTLEERSTIEGHVLLGAIMAFDAVGEGVVQGLRHHHERWDGDGYPNGLKGEDIPLYARIIGIAEAYDAMTSTRPYRQSLTRDQAVAVLRSEGGSQFDAHLVEVFVSTLPEPIQIVERVPALAWAQRQIRELSILFRRVGGVALSAAAATIAIALILGTAVLKPDAFGGRSKSPIIRPEERIAQGGNFSGSRSVGQHTALAAAIDAGVVDSGFTGPAVSNEARRELHVEVLGDKVDLTHDHGSVSNPAPAGNNGGGSGGNGGGSAPRPDPIIIVHEPQPGSGGGTTNPPDEEEPGGGGSTNPPDEPGPVIIKKPGKSGDAPGHNKPPNEHKPPKPPKPPKGGTGGGNGNGHSDDHVTGKDKWGPGGPGNSGHVGGGNSGGNSGGNGNGSGSHGNSGNAPGQDKKDDGWAEAGNGNGNGNAGGNGNGNAGGSTDSGESDSGSTDSGSSDSGSSDSGSSDSGSSDSGSSTGNGNGNSGSNSNAGGNGNGNSDGSGYSPGNSGNAPGHTDDKGKDKSDPADPPGGMLWIY